MLFMVPKIHTDSKKLVYFGTKFEMICNVLACHLQALVMHCIQAIVCWLYRYRNVPIRSARC